MASARAIVRIVSCKDTKNEWRAIDKSRELECGREWTKRRREGQDEGQQKKDVAAGHGLLLPIEDFTLPCPNPLITAAITSIIFPRLLRPGL